MSPTAWFGYTCAPMWASAGPYLGENFPQNLRVVGLVAAMLFLVAALVVSVRRRRDVERVRRLAEDLLTRLKNGEGVTESDPAAESFPSVAKPSVRQKINEITLVPSAIHWSHEPKWQEWASTLLRIGFERVGTFLIPELALPVEIWISSKAQMAAFVFDHIKLGMWLEMVTRYRDGSRVTFTNKKGGLAFSSGRELVFGGRVGPEELLQTALAGRSEGDLYAPTTENVLQGFVDDWRQEEQGRRRRPPSRETEPQRANQKRQRG